MEGVCKVDNELCLVSTPATVHSGAASIMYKKLHRPGPSEHVKANTAVLDAENLVGFAQIVVLGGVKSSSQFTIAVEESLPPVMLLAQATARL
jgi:hypothetical protein